MIGDIKGFCKLCSLDNVFIGFNQQADPKTYAEIQKDLREALFLRVIDIGVDNSGLLLLDNKNRCIVDVRDMKSVAAFFRCGMIGDVVLPPDLSLMAQMAEYTRRITRKGGYNYLVRNMVIMNSLSKNSFDDRFLFQKQ